MRCLLIYFLHCINFNSSFFFNQASDTQQQLSSARFIKTNILKKESIQNNLYKCIQQHFKHSLIIKIMRHYLKKVVDFQMYKILVVFCCVYLMVVDASPYYKMDKRKQLCGEKLGKALSLICEGMYYNPKAKKNCKYFCWWFYIRSGTNLEYFCII